MTAEKRLQPCRMPHCWLWHSWGPWSAGLQAIETMHFGGQVPVVIQERRCTHCNVLEQRTVRP